NFRRHTSELITPALIAENVTTALTTTMARTGEASLKSHDYDVLNVGILVFITCFATDTCELDPRESHGFRFPLSQLFDGIGFAQKRDMMDFALSILALIAGGLTVE